MKYECRDRDAAFVGWLEANGTDVPNVDAGELDAALTRQATCIGQVHVHDIARFEMRRYVTKQRQHREQADQCRNRCQAHREIACTLVHVGDGPLFAGERDPAHMWSRSDCSAWPLMKR